MAAIKKTPYGTWRVVIKDGDRVVTTKTFKRKADARAWARRIEGDRDTAEALACPAAGLRFKDLAEEYRRQWRGKDHSALNRVAWWEERLGTRRVIDITARDIRDHLTDYGKGKAPSTINSMKTAVSAVLTFAMERYDLPDNPARKVRGLHEDNHRDIYLTQEQLQQLLSACAEPKLHALVMLGATTGMRLGESLGLTWDRCDLSRRVATLQTTKNGLPRLVPLPAPAVTALMQIRKPSGLVFQSDRYPETTWNYRFGWYAALDRLGWRGWFHYHDLRHSAASFLINAGCTLEEVGQILGHKSIQTTRRYAHLAYERKQEILDRVMVDIASQSGNINPAT